MLLRLLTAISCVSAVTAAVAESVQLSNAAIRTTFTGALVEMDTPAGTVIPVRFGKDGLVSGQAGVLASVLGAARDRGRWWVADDKLCMKWFRWFEAETRCVILRQDGTRVYWSGPGGRSGTGTIAEPAPVVAATPPAPATRPTIELVDTAPAAEAEPAKAEAAKIEVATIEAREPDDAGAPGKAPPIRFAAAALGVMSLMPPLVSRPSHLLDSATAAAAEPSHTTTESDASSPPQRMVPLPQAVASAARQPDPPAHPKGSKTTSSTVILASFRVAGVEPDDMLNVRSGPSEHFGPVGVLPPEERGVKIIGPCHEEWCPIRHGRMTGWVNRTFLAEETSGPAAALAR